MDLFGYHSLREEIEELTIDLNERIDRIEDVINKTNNWLYNIEQKLNNIDPETCKFVHEHIPDNIKMLNLMLNELKGIVCQVRGSEVKRGRPPKKKDE